MASLKTCQVDDIETPCPSSAFVPVALTDGGTYGPIEIESAPVQLQALDFAQSLNQDPNSLYYQCLNLDKVGAMGHSQGAKTTSTLPIASLCETTGGRKSIRPLK